METHFFLLNTKRRRVKINGITVLIFPYTNEKEKHRMRLTFRTQHQRIENKDKRFYILDIPRYKRRPEATDGDSLFRSQHRRKERKDQRYYRLDIPSFKRETEKLPHQPHLFIFNTDGGRAETHGITPDIHLYRREPEIQNETHVFILSTKGKRTKIKGITILIF